MTVLHRTITNTLLTVDNLPSVHTACGRVNLVIPTFLRVYPQSTGPTTTTILLDNQQ